MSNAHFWQQMYAWAMGLGFMAFVITVAVICGGVGSGHIHNPFAPFIRAVESRRRFRQDMKIRQFYADLAQGGTDPEYVQFLQEKIDRELGK